MNPFRRLSLAASLVALALAPTAGCLTEGAHDSELTRSGEDALNGAACVVNFELSSQWQGGFQASVTLQNETGAAYNGWSLSFTLPTNTTVQNVWNGKLSQSGSSVTVTNESYNGSVPSGGSVNFGFVGNGSGDKPTSFSVNGVECNVPGGTTSSSSSSASSGSSSGGGGSSSSSSSGGAPPPPTSAGYLHTSGNKIVAASGNPVQLTGINWFGLETANYAPHGLWSQSMDWMLDTIKSLGYNTIRLPYCNQLFDAGSTPSGIDMNKNPGLAGLTGIQIMDKVIDGAQKRGLKVFLDRHRPDSGGQSELWYTGQYSEQRWINDWKMLAARYKGNTTVIGADLHNEPHGAATWGTGDMGTDWQLAAERAGNAILSVNPDWLIIVEGVEKVNGQTYWWGGNLSGAAQHPVNLSVANRVVYSPHDYPASVYPQPYFSDSSYPSNLPGVWDTKWGYLAKNNIAPVLLGEFGTKLQTSSDQQWLSSLATYLKSNKLNFTFWCLNADSGDTGGILNDDWSSVNQAKQSILQPLLAPLVP